MHKVQDLNSEAEFTPRLYVDSLHRTLLYHLLSSQYDFLKLKEIIKHLLIIIVIEIFSASPSEAPKTANIRPIASSPAAVKPQTVPVQPQSAASKATASIRPMAIAATSVAPLSTTTGTPTATVMPTTQSQQDAEGRCFITRISVHVIRLVAKCIKKI